MDLLGTIQAALEASDFLSGGEDLLAQIVYDAIRDDIGTVQEKLMNDLQMTRVERDQALKRLDALSESYHALAQKSTPAESTDE